jgi:predicted DNA-binding transcriptional regulator AlpA
MQVVGQSVIMSITARPQLEYCDERLLAQTLAVSISTIRRWRRTGDGPSFVRFGKSVRYRIADVEAWVAAKTRDGSRSLPKHDMAQVPADGVGEAGE